MFAATLLDKTQHLTFGTGVVSAAIRHPAMIAAEAAQFDHLSKGRFILGIGTGSTPTDIELFYASHDTGVRGKMLAEPIETIQKKMPRRVMIAPERRLQALLGGKTP